MEKLTELPNGVWLDLRLVTSICPYDLYPADKLTGYLGHPPKVEVGVGDDRAFATLNFDNFQSAREWAAVFGKEVNESRGN